MVDIFQYLIILALLPIMYIASYLTKELLLRKNLGPFKPIINFLRFIGVFIHELSHFLMCLLVGVRPTGFHVKLRSPRTGRVAPNGYVSTDPRNRSFLQAALIALAPLVIATWLLFWCLTLAFTETLDLLLRIIAGFLCISLLLGGAPSGPDFKYINYWFKRDPKYFIYQIFLVSLSGIIVWLMLSFYEVVLPLDILFFGLVGICYYPLKYFFSSINRLIHSIQFNRHSTINYKKYTQRRFKPAKPHKIKMK